MLGRAGPLLVLLLAGSDNGPTDNTTCLAPYLDSRCTPSDIKHGPSSTMFEILVVADCTWSHATAGRSEHNWKLSGVDISAQITARTTVQLLGVHSVHRHPTKLPPPRSGGVDEEEMAVPVLFSLNKAQ